jgi:hypothetical protein
MWRAIERELVDILKAESADLYYEAGDTFLVDEEHHVIFSITELAKELMRRGIGQRTPR